ncbi:hypothetical protein BDZ97DRAFT_194270 [Flammula alnicola]|nr:hypothetical protein BDZ97DRAFT_194270 [Flammula alnicola]
MGLEEKRPRLRTYPSMCSTGSRRMRRRQGRNLGGIVLRAVLCQSSVARTTGNHPSIVVVTPCCQEWSQGSPTWVTVVTTTAPETTETTGMAVVEDHHYHAVLPAGRARPHLVLLTIEEETSIACLLQGLLLPILVHRVKSTSTSSENVPGKEDTRGERERDGYGRWDDDSRRYGRRNSPLDDSRYYRPSDSYRRGDDREWTRRDVPYLPDRRSSNRADDRAYDYDRRPDSSRWSRPPSRPSSPGPSVRSGPISPPPPPPPALPHPDIPRSPSPPPVPPPPAPPNDTGPRPPSSTPPPAPPPDIRLMKDTQLPQIHAQVKITMKRPEAPRAPHSPLPLELAPVSTAKAMAHGRRGGMRSPRTKSMRLQSCGARK